MSEGEGNNWSGHLHDITQVESAWTICKLSSTLSWLELFHGGLHEVVYCSLRRALCFPLYRHWELALAVLQDTRDLFHLGEDNKLASVQALIAFPPSLPPSLPPPSLPPPPPPCHRT